MKIKTAAAMAMAGLMLFAAGVLSAKEKKIDIKKLNKAVESVKSAAVKSGLTAAEVEKAANILEKLSEDGVPVKYALKVVKSAIERKEYKMEEVKKIGESFADCVNKSGAAKECSKLTQTFIEKKLSPKEAEKIMTGITDAYEKDGSMRQLRIMAQDLLNEGCDKKGLEMAIEAVSESVNEGYSPKESRKMVSRVALDALKDGLKGEKLAKKIRIEAHNRLMEKNKEQFKRGDKEKHGDDMIPSDVKERLKDNNRKMDGEMPENPIH